MRSRFSLAVVPQLTRSVAVLGALSVLGLSPGTTNPAGASSAKDLCAGHGGSGVKCSPGKGRRTAGGNGKASHAGWPAVNGIRWTVVTGTKGRVGTGTDLNDEMLGSHGGDTIDGAAGKDIIWGDQSPTDNDTWQHDALSGGEGNDWIYASHGNNTIDGGAGDDHIFVHFGRGTVECGAGNDVVKTTRHPKYKFHHCEKFTR